MVKEHLGHKMRYQILAAILYMLEEGFDQFGIEGDDYEDSWFRRIDENVVIVIGEAKSIESKDKWTETSLFYTGKKMGPLLQLWERKQKKDITDFVFFTNIPISNNFLTFGSIDPIKISKLDKIKSKVQKQFENRIKPFSRFDKGIDEFLKRLQIKHRSVEDIESGIVNWINSKYNSIMTLADLKIAVDYFSGSSYKKGEGVSHRKLLNLLIPVIKDEDTKITSIEENLKLIGEFNEAREEFLKNPKYFHKSNPRLILRILASNCDAGFDIDTIKESNDIPFLIQTNLHRKVLPTNGPELKSDKIIFRKKSTYENIAMMTMGSRWDKRFKNNINKITFQQEGTSVMLTIFQKLGVEYINNKILETNSQVKNRLGLVVNVIQTIKLILLQLFYIIEYISNKTQSNEFVVKIKIEKLKRYAFCYQYSETWDSIDIENIKKTQYNNENFDFQEFSINLETYKKKLTIKDKTTYLFNNFEDGIQSFWRMGNLPYNQENALDLFTIDQI